MSGTKELEIYFSDLNTKGKKKILKFFNIKKPQEANLDILPLDTLCIEEE